MLSLDDLTALVGTGEVDTVLVAFPDLQGRLVGKRVVGRHFLDHVVADGIEACDYLLAVDVDMEPLDGYTFANWDLGYGDVTARPDMTTLRLVPWLPATALVVCDLDDGSGTPIEVSPRRILQRQVARAREAGFAVKCGTELEFYVFEDSFREAEEKAFRGLVPHSSTIEDYQIFQTSRDEYFIREIRNAMIGAGIPVEFSKGEAGRGQHEINVTYGGALETADRHCIYKNGVREIAALRGRAATFMAKWSMTEVGSSCHVHSSLWGAGDDAPAMWDAGAESNLSLAARQFLAGQIAGAAELGWMYAPYVNSYKRYQPGSWAPTALAWGIDNRTCGFRIVGHGAGRRIECRIPGADVNPYLTLAALIASGLAGIEAQLDPGEPFAGNAYDAHDLARVPATLVEAIAAFEASGLARSAFGDDVHHHLLNTARQEWALSNRVVTDWELRRNFERI